MASRPIRSEASTQLVLSHITYTYPGSSEPALREVSVTFPLGWTGIVGDNGGGKTTLARVAGFRLACQGAILFDTPPLSYRPNHARDRNFR